MKPLRASAIHDPARETLSAAARREALSARLTDLVARAYANATGVRSRMLEAGVHPEDIRGGDDLLKLPIVRKDDLGALQAADLPFGGLTAVAVGKLQRIFMSPGPIYDPQGEGLDFWRFAPALAAAGFRAGDIVQNTFSYHMTPAGFMFDGALRSLGCVVVPAGVGQTELQVRMAADLGVTGYVGTPSFLHTLLTKARELNRALAIEVAFVSAEMLPPSLRSELENDFGIRVLQGYGTADLGMLAYECPQKDGMHLAPDAIVEVLDLETRASAVPGQPGEVVATIFDAAYPLIRFATGDISSLAEDQRCPCGRGAPKLTGILGRVGDAVKVKGMFIRGAQIEEVLRRFAEVGKFQAIVTRAGHQDQLSYSIELNCSAPDQAGLARRVADALRDQLKVRGEVEFIAPGTLPAAAKKIDDRRVWK